MKLSLLFFAIIMMSSFAMAQEDGAYLDPAYKNLIHPKVEKNSRNKSVPFNDVAKIIEWQTPVKSQQSRGTCSIFSATAYLEGLLVRKGEFNTELDLSEEWLEYTAVRGSATDGSSAWKNFSSIRKHGMPLEETMPYIGVDWTTDYHPLVENRCGHLVEDFKRKPCLVVHRDPALLFMNDLDILNGDLKDEEFVLARREAWQFLNAHISFQHANFSLSNVETIKNLLEQGMPVVLEMDFYYGAWNHRKAETYGIGRNLDHWYQGIVAHAEPGSVDVRESRKNPAGHSILVVGYDDNKIVEKTVKMQDGTEKTFTYKGVYYFKNSWGSESFGREFEINGVKYPGYGMITQKYAHEEGSFFIMPLL